MKKLLQYFTTRKTKYGGYATLIMLIAAVIVIIVNLVSEQIPVEFDMTSRELFTLSEQTEDILKGLTSDVTIYALFQTGQESTTTTEALERYKRVSEHIIVKYIDPDLNPQFVTKFLQQESSLPEGTLIVEQGTNWKIILPSDIYEVGQNPYTGETERYGFAFEKNVTSAVLYVTSGYTPVIYELTGHLEYDISDTIIGYNLYNENYVIENLDLLTAPAVPDDAAVVMMIAPQNDYTPDEVGKILDYINGGGRAVFMVSYADTPHPQLDSLFEALGIRLVNGIVMESDLNRLYSGENPYFFAPYYAEHVILDPLSQNGLNVFLPFAIGLEITESRPRQLTFNPLLTSSSRSWLRSEPDSALYRIEGDVTGPITVAYAMHQTQWDEYENEGTRAVIIGCGDFLTGNFGYINANIDFFMNTISWVNEHEESITIRSKSLFMLDLDLTSFQTYLYSAIVVIAIPLIIMIYGLIVYLRRRHL